MNKSHKIHKFVHSELLNKTLQKLCTISLNVCSSSKIVITLFYSLLCYPYKRVTLAADDLFSHWNIKVKNSITYVTGKVFETTRVARKKPHTLQQGIFNFSNNSDTPV